MHFAKAKVTLMSRYVGQRFEASVIELIENKLPCIPSEFYWSVTISPEGKDCYFLLNSVIRAAARTFTDGDNCMFFTIMAPL